MQRNDGRGFRAIALGALFLLLLGVQPLVRPAKAASDGWSFGYHTIFRWDGSEWEEYWFVPTANELRSVDMVSAIDGWAVGDLGTIIHWDGSSWSTVTSPTDENLLSVDMGFGYGWAVGDDGTIVRLNGSSWSTVTSPTENQLYSVDMVSGIDAWAVGEGGTIIHWDGSSWSTITSPTSNELRSVDMVSANDGWAVGYWGTIIHWDGSSWSTVTSPTSIFLYSVDMVSGVDGWAVGEGGTIIRWDGSSWSTVTSPAPENLFCVDMVSTSEGWAGGWNGVIIRWDGSSWSLEPNPMPAIYSIDMAGEADGYVLEDLAARVTALEARVKAVEHRSLALVARGPNNVIAYRIYTDGLWGGWTILPGKTIDSPTATVIDNQLHIAMIAPNGRLYHSWVDLSTYTFSGWTNISGSYPSHPALTFLP
jgi:hypothetical protein